MRRQLRGEIRLSGSIIAAIKLRRCSIARNKWWGRQINCRIDFEFCLSWKMSCQNTELNLSWRLFPPPSPPFPSPTLHLACKAIICFFFSFVISVSNLWHRGLVLSIYGNGLSSAGDAAGNGRNGVNPPPLLLRVVSWRRDIQFNPNLFSSMAAAAKRRVRHRAVITGTPRSLSFRWINSPCANESSHVCLC